MSAKVPRSPRRSACAALTAQSAPVLAAIQVPAVSGVPLSIEYRPMRAAKLSGSISVRMPRIGHTDGKASLLGVGFGSSATHSLQALRRKCR